MIADLMRRGYGREELMRAPYAQVMLEWDAALFNEEVRAHDEAMAQIDDQLENLPRTGEESRSARARLVARRRELTKTMRKRVARFWHGCRESWHG